MSKDQLINVSESLLVSMTEEELATYYRSVGIQVICHHDRYWRKTALGFYEPLHWMARLSARQALTSPTLFCWGFRATLSAEATSVANGSLPAHLLTNIQGYDLQSLGSNRRNQLRRCYKRSQIAQITDLQLLQEQGYEVRFSASKRTSYEKPLSKEAYLASLSADKPGQLVLVGLIDGKLGGYLTGYAVSGSAYIDEVRIATEAFSSYVGIGLVFEFVQACRRSKDIHEIVYGLHSQEDSALCVFKEGMGFPVKQIPSRVEMNPFVGKFIKSRHPNKYYRLTGDV
jgi:hypothetical protein